MNLFKSIKFSVHDRKLLKEMMKYSIPLIPSEIGHWVISVSDRLIITFFLGSSFNGLYAISAKFPTLIVSIYNLFNMSWQETVSLHIKDADINDYISKTFSNVLNLFSSAVALLCALLPFIYEIIIGEDFLDSYKYILILLMVYN